MFPLEVCLAPAVVHGVCPVAVHHGFSFKFPPYTKPSDIRHLLHPTFNKTIIMLHIHYGCLTNSTFGKQALSILSIFAQAGAPHQAAALALLGQLAETDDITQCLFLFWGASGGPPPYEADTFPTTRGCSRQMFDRHNHTELPAVSENLCF